MNGSFRALKDFKATIEAALAPPREIPRIVVARKRANKSKHKGEQL
jgi:hypothetical protein